MLRRAQILPSTRQVRPHPGSHFPNSTVLHPALFFPIFLVDFFPVFRRPTVGVTARLKPPRPSGAVYRRRPRSRPRSRQSVSTTAVRNDVSFVATPRDDVVNAYFPTTTGSTTTLSRVSSSSTSFASIYAERTKRMNECDSFFHFFTRVQKLRLESSDRLPLLTNRDPLK